MLKVAFICDLYNITMNTITIEHMRINSQWKRIFWSIAWQTEDSVWLKRSMFYNSLESMTMMM